MTPEPTRALYLHPGPEAVFAVLHTRPRAGHAGVAVVMCPPFGFEEVCSHRPRREWAEHMSAGGYTALRLDLPGTGDSEGSPRDPDRLARWTEAVGGAAAWLKSAQGELRVAALGIGLGGLVALQASAEGWPIDDLILWGTPGRGRTLLRELRAFARMEAAHLSSIGEEQPPRHPTALRRPPAFDQPADPRRSAGL